MAHRGLKHGRYCRRKERRHGVKNAVLVVAVGRLGRLVTLGRLVIGISTLEKGSIGTISAGIRHHLSPFPPGEKPDTERSFECHAASPVT